MRIATTALLCAILSCLLLSDAARAQVAEQEVELDRALLAGKKFRFSWRSDAGAGFNGVARLIADGNIQGIGSPNESFWEVDAEGRLLFKHADGRVSSTFEWVERREGLLHFSGPFHLREGIVHTLEEVPTPVLRSDESIGGEDAARISYSNQEFLYLDEGESAEFELPSGERRTIQLLRVRDEVDSVIGLTRRADVRVAVDGAPLELVCSPYVMPTVHDGLRIQADTTSGWIDLPKRVQLSVWDAADPIVDPEQFVFPLPHYRLFALGMQAFNEPVHLGHRDGDPEGQRFHHDYGIDFAAFEGRERVVSCVAGEVIHVSQDQGAILLEDEGGIVFEYGHLDSILPHVRPGARLSRGQPVGLVGRRGPSGNFSHLHVGTYLSRDHLDAGRNNRALNLYPWMVAAYLAASEEGLLAVARPHHAVRTGERVFFDGRSSIARDAAIVSYRWAFHDGTEARGPVAEHSYDTPGQYPVALWVEDDWGHTDVDFCKVKVFSTEEPEAVIPALFVAYEPTRFVDVGQPVTFRLWPQGGDTPGRECGAIRIEFGDGTILDDCAPYDAIEHRFDDTGVHVVTVSTTFGDLPVTRKVDVVVRSVIPGADERTPSIAHFFDWINNQYEGTNEAHSLVNLAFFQWIRDEYGMELDIYSLDVGNVDDGPFTAGVGRLIPDHCGTLANREFAQQFPRGFGPPAEAAARFDCRLGIWLGPDGFGDTPEEEQARIDMLVELCRDHDFRMFKLDAVAGGLRSEKEDALARALRESRAYCPDLIVLNERIDLGRAEPYATTYLWEGAETYIDVFMSNDRAAPHHRAGAVARERVPGTSRLVEDHGVCFSSCLDFWEDDLVLQTFSRSLIMAPQYYGSPWLLRDDEFPRLARLCNLHRRHRDILVDGMELPEERYGPHAMVRGSGETRFLTLRNLTWETTRYRVELDASIGLTGDGAVEVRRLHPSERILGTFDGGSEVEVEVLPFRACLVMATTEGTSEIGLTGCDYEVENDLPGRPARVRLLGLPGTRSEIALHAGERDFDAARLDGVLLTGEELAAVRSGTALAVEFPGTPLTQDWHRKLGDLTPCDLPEDAEALYEATCFAADSNALEVRCLDRAGPSRIPQVHWARHAFFTQPMFTNRGIRDRNLFDGDIETFFIARREGGALRVDFGEPLALDEIVIRIRDREEHDLNPALHTFADDSLAEVSADLKSWKPVGSWSGKGTIAGARLDGEQPVRYLRVRGAPRRIAEVEGYAAGQLVTRHAWRASNLFAPYSANPAVRAWSLSVTLDEVPPNAYLAVPIHGRHGDEGAWAAMRVDGRLVGAPDRSVSFPSNTWEYKNVESESDYTYYFPLEPEMAGARVDLVVLGLEGGGTEVRPEAWLTAYPNPYVSRELILE